MAMITCPRPMLFKNTFLLQTANLNPKTICEKHCFSSAISNLYRILKFNRKVHYFEIFISNNMSMELYNSYFITNVIAKQLICSAASHIRNGILVTLGPIIVTKTSNQ